ncbi:FAD-dependent oxidoreductase [Aquimarina gracilis]|uniref:FAD-dependent oxidoreductase n=1 Tax=Aquimarina gracilis TaxID=874422 RepID=A0ABU5ZVU8_9FLAO|nr:FAD-dependent oxidoreductase [Aquimarina gracilis]MEB3345983.1 FAD-dependent oxidoreductase [Aquimarina gracilis]
MRKSDYKIYIVGAGISGLIAANVLEQSGYHPIIIESSNSPGGRVKTDFIENYQMDHGFQVLLTAYPAAQKYLNLEKLFLQRFLPGAVIFCDGEQKIIGDPLRNLSLLFPTLVANVGSISDKLKILKLNKILKKTTIKAIFDEEEESTHSFLQEFGFSNEIIEQFFRPFFSGIFLEPDLQTSSRMFKFVYKMFGEGSAAIPKSGIAEITNQLVAKLDNTTFLFNTSVKKVEEGKIILGNGKDLVSHFTIVATEPSTVVPNLKNQQVDWKSCDTLYFEVKSRVIKKPLIGLVADQDSIINNICYHTVLQTSLKPKNELLSVTIVKEHDLDEIALIKKVKIELKKYCNIEVDRFMKRYKINRALPDLSNIQYEVLPSETKLTPSIFIAGDQQLNGSLNAAMISGERAALGVIDTLENGLVVEEFTSEFK